MRPCQLDCLYSISDTLESVVVDVYDDGSVIPQASEDIVQRKVTGWLNPKGWGMYASLPNRVLTLVFIYCSWFLLWRLISEISKEDAPESSVSGIVWGQVTARIWSIGFTEANSGESLYLSKSQEKNTIRSPQVLGEQMILWHVW
jgi:hypothetical protein